MLIVAFVSFSLFNFVGDPVNNMVGQEASDERREEIREKLGIQKWLIFGGSWGSTLALIYGISYPERCLGFVLRGVFLGTYHEINWFLYGIKSFFPEAHNNFKYLLDSMFCGKAIVIFSKIFFEKFGKNFHLLKDFFVILAFIRIRGIFFLCKLLNILGQISESTNNANFGFQWLMKCLVKKFKSNG